MLKACLKSARHLPIVYGVLSHKSSANNYIQSFQFGSTIQATRKPQTPTAFTSIALSAEMFSKFKLAKPANVLYRRGPRPYEREHPTDILSVPLLQHYDRAIQELRAENEQLKTQTTTQFHELMKARAEAFELREQLKLLHDEVAQSRLLVDRTKNSVKFNTSKKSYWECDKASRSQKRKKIRGLMMNAVEKLPKEFKPVEVSL